MITRLLAFLGNADEWITQESSVFFFEVANNVIYLLHSISLKEERLLTLSKMSKVILKPAYSTQRLTPQAKNGHSFLGAASTPEHHCF